MTRSQRLALIGLGEVGQVLAPDLHAAGCQNLIAWDRLFPERGSVPSRAAASLPFLATAVSMTEATRNASLIICAVTAGECVAAAREIAGTLRPGIFYLDLNSVSPGTREQAARTIEAAGGRYVEAAVMSPIGPRRIASPIWLGGPHAQDFQPTAQALGFLSTAVYSSVLGTASAAKMCRSVIVKGMEALLAEALLTARRHGVEDAVLGSLDDLFRVGDWRKLAHYMISRSLQHGKRRAEEMREAAHTVAEAGLEPWMSRGCVERQKWAAARGEALRAAGLTDMLDCILAQSQPAQESALP